MDKKNSSSFLKIKNCEPVDADAVPLFDIAVFRKNIIDFVVKSGGRIVALFGVPAEAGKSVHLYAVLTRISEKETLYALSSIVAQGDYDSITQECPEAHLFEREIWEQNNIIPKGHPWLKPIRFTGPNTLPGVTEYFQVEGEEVHEVAVGPVHAGIIEPGHFRFQCHGETVFHLEISLGYQHRGIERKLVGGPDKRSLHYFETLAGDTTIGHSLTYSQLVESLVGLQVPKESSAWRAVALELERLANHIGDLGALANDVGFLPTASYCGRIRGDFLNMTAFLCGNRFGRGFCLPGGTNFDLGGNEGHAKTIIALVETGLKDVQVATKFLWSVPSVVSRFQGAGPVSRETAKAIGLVGVAARASGLKRDVRRNFPTGIYKTVPMTTKSWPSGDVYARARVRWLEIKESCAYIAKLLKVAPECKRSKNDFSMTSDLPSNRFIVSLTEGWRGEICHVAASGAKDGKFRFYKMVDPSFHNWFGLAIALRNQQISDFPLCNKSFNLSYCGHDL